MLQVQSKNPETKHLENVQLFFLEAILGAKMNQLAYVTTNLEAQSANEKSARSTIVDTNYSAETASLTKGQILQQAATAMLAQANQMPNVILSLLK